LVPQLSQRATGFIEVQETVSLNQKCHQEEDAELQGFY